MRRPLPVALAATCAAALAMYCWLGTYVRYLGDDFCTAVALAAKGFWHSQSYWYNEWTGRYAFTFAVTAAELLGPRIVPFLPALLIAAWSFVAVRSFRSAAAIAAVYAIIDGARDPYQSVLWQTGLFTYAVPLVLMTAWCGAWLRRDDDRVRPIDVIVPLLAGGFSETAAIGNVIFFALAALFAAKRRPFVAAAAAALVSLAIVAAAPGNAMRASAAVLHGGTSAALFRALFDDLLMEAAAFPQLLLVFAAAASFTPRRASRRMALFAALLVVGCAAGSELASFLALGRPLPLRALIVVHFFSVIAAAIWGACFEAKALFVALLVLALGAPAVTAVRNLRAVPAERATARSLDDLDTRLRGGATVVDAPDAIHGVAMITSDPASWSNGCIADFYRLPSVRRGGRFAKQFEDPLVHPPERPR